MARRWSPRTEAGERGRVVAYGAIQALRRCQNSVTVQTALGREPTVMCFREHPPPPRALVQELVSGDGAAAWWSPDNQPVPEAWRSRGLWKVLALDTGKGQCSCAA